MHADCNSDEATEYFEFLDDLRASGKVNMFAARPYLMEAFGLDGDLAASVISAWMETFDRVVPAQDRAEQAFRR